MPGHNTELAAVLQRISAIGVATRPTLNFAVPEDAIGFFVDCVRTCILPRTVAVHLDGKNCLLVSTKGGRLLQVLESADGVGIETGAVSADTLSGFCEQLMALFRDKSTIAVEFHRSQATEEPGSTGVSAEQILSTLNFQFLRNLPSDRLDILIDGAQHVLLASYVLTKEIEQQSGDFETPQELLNWLDQACRNFAASREIEDASVLVIYRPVCLP